MNLIDAMYDALNRSKCWQRNTIVVGLFLFLLTVSNLFIASSCWPKITAILAALLQIVMFVFRYLMTANYNIGEQIRRMALLKDSLGINVSEIEIAKIIEQLGTSRPTKGTFVGTYYESTTPLGARRLLENLQESSFFTRGLARCCVKVFGIISGVGLIIVTLGFISLVLVGTDQGSLEIAARFVVASMAFWATGDIASITLKYHSLSKSADRVLDRTTNLLSSAVAPTKENALLTLNDYNCSLVSASPIPQLIYERKKNLLNEAWKTRKHYSR